MKPSTNEIRTMRLLLLFLLWGALVPFSIAQPPIISNQYTADPSASPLLGGDKGVGTNHFYKGIRSARVE